MVQTEKAQTIFTQNLWEKHYQYFYLLMKTHHANLLCSAPPLQTTSFGLKLLQSLSKASMALLVLFFFFFTFALTGCSNKHETSWELQDKVTVPMPQEGCKAMNFAAVRGKSMPCLPSQLLPVLLLPHMNVKKCNHAYLSLKEGKRKAHTCGQREGLGNTFWHLIRQDQKKELLVCLTWVVNQKSSS